MKNIPDWIIKYDECNYRSSAGKAVRELINIIKEESVCQCPNNYHVRMNWEGQLYCSYCIKPVKPGVITSDNPLKPE